MIALSLPYFISNSHFNKRFADYCTNYQDKLKIPIVITSQFGAFPWSLWNGGDNSNTGPAITYTQINTLFNTCYGPPIRLDCSNILLSDTDFFDRHQNTIIDLGKNYGHVIELSNLKLYTYLKQHYENYNYIISSNFQHTINMDINTIDTLLSHSDIQLISMFAELDLTECKNKNKIEIVIGDPCETCQNQRKCQENEMLSQHIYSSKTKFGCNKIQTNIQYYDNIKKYMQQGFTHFKIASLGQQYNLHHFNLNLIFNFVKPEYISHCIKECID